MAKPRTIQQINRDQFRKATELLKIEHELMRKVAPRAPTRIRGRARQSSEPRDFLRDAALR